MSNMIQPSCILTTEEIASSQILYLKFRYVLGYHDSIFPAGLVSSTNEFQTLSSSQNQTLSSIRDIRQHYDISQVKNYLLSAFPKSSLFRPIIAGLQHDTPITGIIEDLTSRTLFDMESTLLLDSKSIIQQLELFLEIPRLGFVRSLPDIIFYKRGTTVGPNGGEDIYCVVDTFSSELSLSIYRFAVIHLILVSITLRRPIPVFLSNLTDTTLCLELELGKYGFPIITVKMEKELHTAITPKQCVDNNVSNHWFSRFLRRLENYIPQPLTNDLPSETVSCNTDENKEKPQVFSIHVESSHIPMTGYDDKDNTETLLQSSKRKKKNRRLSKLNIDMNENHSKQVENNFQYKTPEHKSDEQFCDSSKQLNNNLEKIATNVSEEVFLLSHNEPSDKTPIAVKPTSSLKYTNSNTCNTGYATTVPDNSSSTKSSSRHPKIAVCMVEVSEDNSAQNPKSENRISFGLSHDRPKHTLHWDSSDSTSSAETGKELHKQNQKLIKSSKQSHSSKIKRRRRACSTTAMSTKVLEPLVDSGSTQSQTMTKRKTSVLRRRNAHSLSCIGSNETSQDILNNSTPCSKYNTAKISRTERHAKTRKESDIMNNKCTPVSDFSRQQLNERLSNWSYRMLAVKQEPDSVINNNLVPCREEKRRHSSVPSLLN